MWLMGEVSALIKVGPQDSCPITFTNRICQDVKPAKEIIDDMVREAKSCIERGQGYISGRAKAKL